MQAIKALVIFMGVLLLAGLGLLGYGMYTKAGKAVKDAPVVASPLGSPAAAGAVVASAGLAGFGTLGLDQPAGTSIAAVTVAGSQMVITLRGGGLGDRVVVVDSTTRAVIGQVTLDAALPVPAAAAPGYAAPPVPTQ